VKNDTLDLTEADKVAARESYIGNEYGIKTPDGKL
jgi:hypothetical protein